MFWGHYQPDAGKRSDPNASPMHAKDLSKVPPGIIVSAGRDPLRDEGRAYAEALAAAGVAVDLEEAPGMIHGFVSMFEAVPDAMPFIERAGTKLKAALG